MKIPKISTIENNKLLFLLNQEGFNAKENKTLFGSKYITLKNQEIDFIIQNKNNEYNLETITPTWVKIMSFIIAIILGSIIMSIIMGQVMITAGGFVIYIAGAMMGDIFYKKNKKETLLSTFNAINNLV